MAVAHSVWSESHGAATGSTSQASFQWDHAGGASIRGALVFVWTDHSTDYVTGVTYGGVAMTAVSGGRAQDTAGEAGSVKAYYLKNPPTGTQTIIVSRTNNGQEMWACCASQTCAADKELEVHTAGIVLLEGDGTYAVQSVTDGSPGSNSQRYACGHSGGANLLSPGTGSSAGVDFDTGNFTCTAVHETTPGQGARNVGFTFGTSDDRAAVHLAVKEVAPSPLSATPNGLSIVVTFGTLVAKTTQATPNGLSIVVSFGTTKVNATVSMGSWPYAPLKAALSAWWELDETSGTRVDRHTNGLDLTDENTVGSTTGIAGNAAHFIRANAEGLTHAHHTAFSMGSTGMSIIAFVRLTSKVVSSHEEIAGHRGGGNNNYYLRYNGFTNRYNLGANGGANEVDASTFGEPPTATWHFLYAGHDGTNLRISVNDGTVNTAGLGALNGGTATWGIGVSSGDGENMDGDIDIVALWKRNLSASEITWLYNGGAGRDYDELETPNLTLGEPTANLKATPNGLLITVTLGNPTGSAPTNDATPDSLIATVSFGTLVATGKATPTGLSIPLTLGSPTGTLKATPNGLSIVVTLGSPTVSQISASPAGLSIPVTFGTLTAKTTQATPNGLSVVVTFGTLTAKTTQATPAGLSIPLTFGAFEGIAGGSSARPDGLSIPVTFGTLTAKTTAATPNGLAITLTLGTPTVTATVTATGLSIPLTLGSPSALQTSAQPNGLSVPLTLGAPTVTGKATPNGLAVTVTFGTLTAKTTTATPNGLLIPLTLGNPTAQGGMGTAYPASLDIPVTFGTLTGTGKATPDGVSVAITFGTPTILRQATPAGLAITVTLGNPTGVAAGSAVPEGLFIAVSFGAFAADYRRPPLIGTDPRRPVAPVRGDRGSIHPSSSRQTIHPRR